MNGATGNSPAAAGPSASDGYFPFPERYFRTCEITRPPASQVLRAAWEGALIKIEWGSVQEFLDVVPDRRIIIRENSAEIAGR